MLNVGSNTVEIGQCILVNWKAKVFESFTDVGEINRPISWVEFNATASIWNRPRACAQNIFRVSIWYSSYKDLFRQKKSARIKITGGRQRPFRVVRLVILDAKLN